MKIILDINLSIIEKRDIRTLSNTIQIQQTTAQYKYPHPSNMYGSIKLSQYLIWLQSVIK